MDDGAGIRTVKDANGINGGLGVLHVLGSRHGSVSDCRIEFTLTRWRTISKEDNNLLGVFATRSPVLSQLQTIIGTCGTGGFNTGNCILKSFHVAAGTINQVLHSLRVIVDVPFVTIRIVADIVGLIARELNDGNLMLPIHALDTLVLLGDGINKAVRSVLQCIDTLGGISAAHRIVHRTRGIQHHHDIERRGDRHG